MKMKIGLQLFSMKNAFRENPAKALSDIAQAGYRYVELANQKADIDPGCGFDIPAPELKRMANAAGVTITGGHVSPQDGKGRDAFYRDTAAMMRIIEYYNEIGATDFVLPIDFFPTRDYLLRRCEDYNNLGVLCQEHGMRLLYHNHYHEFQLFGEDTMFDLIMGNTQPDLMQVELDAYWTIRGKFDPVEKLRQYGKRVVLIHQKDFPLSQIEHFCVWQTLDQSNPIDWEMFKSIKRSEYFTEVGDGVLKIQDIIDAGNELEIPLIFVEQDYTTMTELQSIQRSMENFKRMRGLQQA